MKSFIVIVSSVLLCSCADMYVTRTEVAGGAAGGPIDTKDFGSKDISHGDGELRGRGKQSEGDLHSAVLRGHGRV